MEPKIHLEVSLLDLPFNFSHYINPFCKRQEEVHFLSKERKNDDRWCSNNSSGMGGIKPCVVPSL